MKKYYSTILLVAVTIFFSILIFSSKPPNNNVNYKVGATIFPIYDIARNITGDTLEVGLILPPGASPHTFEPSASLVRNFANADVIYAVGADFDNWVDPLLNVTTAEKQFVSSGISLLTEEGNIDPHYWLSVDNAKIIASSITTNLSQQYPEHKETFEANLLSYLSQLSQTDNEIKDQLSTLNNKNIITLHDSYYYFAENYGLNIVGTFEPTAGREPTPRYLIELTQGVEQANVTTIYSEPQLSSSGLKAFSKDNGLIILELDPIGGIENRNSFIDLMLYNANQIKKNK